MTNQKLIELPERAKELINRNGSVRAASKAVGIEASYLHRMAQGKKFYPSDKVLTKMGLRRIELYERIGDHERDEAIDILAQFAEGRTTHAYTGACPSDESPSSRDPDCMVCWAIDTARAAKEGGAR